MGGQRSSARLPHDLATFVIEQALGLTGGFFNLTAHGATFRSADRRRTQPGRALIVANRDALDEARDRWHDLRTGEGFELVRIRLPLPTKPAPVQRDRRHRS